MKNLCGVLGGTAVDQSLVQLRYMDPMCREMSRSSSYNASCPLHPSLVSYSQCKAKGPRSEGLLLGLEIKASLVLGSE
jgi:hypothetical protein